MLAVYVFMLFAIPSRLTVGTLGGAGSPALVLGAGCGFLWAFSRVDRDARSDVGSHPVRRALAALLIAFMLSYISGMSRAIDPAETRSADLGLITLMSWAGLLLFTHDCIPSRSRLVDLARYVTIGGACVAALGIAQFVTGQEIVDKLHIPGLTENSTFVALSMREGFNRPTGTALHPIEFGAVLTMVLPIALALALSETRRGPLARWSPAVLIMAAITLSVSRSAILGAAVGLVVFAATLPAPVVRRLAASVVVFLVLVFLTVPGMLGTVLGLFTTVNNDPSVESRTGSYSVAEQFFRNAPIFGRGFGTFLPSYRIFDNQYLLSFIEVGVVGSRHHPWPVWNGHLLRTEGASDGERPRDVTPRSSVCGLGVCGRERTRDL